MIKSNKLNSDGTFGDSEPFKFTYKYAGQGVWEDTLGSKYRIADGSLLEEGSLWAMTYERIK